MLGLAFAVHAGSALDLLLPVRDRTPQQILIRGLIVGLVLLAIYIPPGRVLLHFVDARQWLRSEEPFAAGDVVLFNPRAYVSEEPRVGDVVLFQDSNWVALRRSIATRSFAAVAMGWIASWRARVAPCRGKKENCGSMAGNRLCGR